MDLLSGRGRTVFGSLLALAGVVACLASAPTALADEIVVTALFGTVRADGQAIAIGDRLSTDAPDQIVVETALESGCALLHGDALLVEMSPSTKLKIRSGVEGAGPVVEILDGSARVTTRRAAADAATEIRTPSAIVRPRSSTLYLEVDGNTGTTVVASLDSRAFVLSSDPRHKRGVFLDTSQWVAVPNGEPPGRVEPMEAGLAERFEGAATRRRYRDSAVAQHVQRESESLLGDIARADVPEAEPASLANPLPTPKELSFRTETIDRILVCDPTTCGLFSVPDFEPGPSDPPGCIGIPGEQCQR